MTTFDLKVALLLFTFVINNWIGFCIFMYIDIPFYSSYNCKWLKTGNICKLYNAGLSFPFSPGSLHSYILNIDSIPVTGIPGCFLSVFPMPHPASPLLLPAPDGFFLFRQVILVLPALQGKFYGILYAFLINIPFSGAQTEIKRTVLI